MPSSLFLMFVPAGVAIYLVLRGIRAFERRGSAPEQIAMLSAQLADLREVQWQVQSAVDTLREEQRFAEQLRTVADPSLRSG